MNKLFTMFIQVSTYWQTFWILYINEDRLCWWFLSLNQRERRNEAITLVDSPRFLLNWRHSLTSLLLCPPAPPLFLSSFKCKGVVDLAACYVVTIMLLAICDPFHFMSWTSWGSSQRGQTFWGSDVLKLIFDHSIIFLLLKSTQFWNYAMQWMQLITLKIRLQGNCGSSLGAGIPPSLKTLSAPTNLLQIFHPLCGREGGIGFHSSKKHLFLIDPSDNLRANILKSIHLYLPHVPR